MLRDAGFQVTLIDCVDAENFGNGKGYRGKIGPYGTGKLRRTPVAKPPILAHIPRKFCRYGISPGEFRTHLASIPKPDLILVTSIMTYWYPGVRETIEILKDHFPKTPVWLGGIYATLIPRHAQEVGRPDRVIEGPFARKHLEEITDLLGSPPPARLETTGLPFWEGYKTHHFLCVRTSHGCPFQCPYCASHLLFPGFSEEPVQSLARDIVRLHDLYGIRDFAFFDDALLVNASSRLLPLLENLRGKGLRLRFHTPNGIHIRLITRKIADRMKDAGFVTLRLSLETVSPERMRRLGSKVTLAEFDRALDCLVRAGFSREDIKVYLLAGLPGQSYSEIEASVAAVLARGVRPSLAEYSPIPWTPLWNEAVKASPYPLATEPLTHNNILLPCGGDEITKERLDTLKQRIRAAFASSFPEDGAVKPELPPQEEPDEGHPREKPADVGEPGYIAFAEDTE